MRQLISISDIVETIQNELGTCEICATADAGFAESRSELSVTCDAFMRIVNQRGADEQRRPAWLPRVDVVKAHVPREEAAAEAKDIFRSWIKKVRTSVHQQPQNQQ